MDTSGRRVQFPAFGVDGRRHHVRICILGAGSLGSVMGGALAAAGHDVCLVTRNEAHVAAVTRDGLLMRQGGEEKVVRLAARTSATGLPPVDLVIVLVKSLDTVGAIEAAQGVIGPDTLLLSLQNGMGQEDLLAELCGAHRVIAGKTYVGGLLTHPGVVTAGYKGKETIIGELDSSLSPRIRSIAEAFRASGLATVVSENIRGAIWDKLFVNVATGAVSAITGLAYGPLYGIPEVEACAVRAVAEAMDVARASGVSVATRAPVDAWVKAAAGLPPEFRASMLQSIDKGALTEVDFINGAVVRAGRAVGVETPVNETLVALVKGVERARGLGAAATDRSAA